MYSKRPTGVTIIGILDIIGGIIMLLLGAALFIAAAIIPNLSSLDANAAKQLQDKLSPYGIPVQILGPIFDVIAAALVALGIASIIVAIGLLGGKKWAWTVTLILSFIGIAISIAEIATANFGGIANLVINGIIIYYLYRPNVKVYFGKVPAPAV